jgi:hypothetical protein
MSWTKIAVIALVALTAMASSGCARWFARHSTGTTHDAVFVVTAEKTAFYRYGPQQGQGPDQDLQKDTLVTLIRHAFGYSKVRLADGQQGFVANDDLTRASERLIAEATAPVSHADESSLPPTPKVKLPASDSSPEFEPTPIPEPLMPQ